MQMKSTDNIYEVVYSKRIGYGVDTVEVNIEIEVKEHRESSTWQTEPRRIADKLSEAFRKAIKEVQRELAESNKS